MREILLEGGERAAATQRAGKPCGGERGPPLVQLTAAAERRCSFRSDVLRMTYVFAK